MVAPAIGVTPRTMVTAVAEALAVALLAMWKALAALMDPATARRPNRLWVMAAATVVEGAIPVITAAAEAVLALAVVRVLVPTAAE